MWIVLLVNVIVAAVAVIFGFQNRAETLNLFNAGYSFYHFWDCFTFRCNSCLSRFRARHQFNVHCRHLIIVGIIMLSVSLITKCQE